MKATLEGTYAGSGGKQHIKIVGELTAENLGSTASVDLSDIEDKVKALEAVVLGLQAQVQALQAQNLQASVKELAAALEAYKAEQAEADQPAPVVSQTETVPVVVAESTPAPATSSKKKSG